MKERWFNYRPLCLIFGFLLLGSVFSFYLTNHIVASILVAIVVFAILTFIAIIRKKIKYVLIPFIAFLIGISCYNLAVFNFNKSINYTPKTIQARVYDISNESDGFIMVEMDNCKFDNNKINDNLSVFIYDYGGIFENIEVGSVLKFKPTKFYKSDLMEYNTPSSKLYNNDLKYTVIVNIEDIEFIKTDETLAEKFKQNVKENISLGLTNENVEIVYSCLFGDKDMLSEKQYAAYKLSGVAHLLAVSGLHVGIIVGLLSFIFNFTKRKKWWKIALISVLLLFYMYLCNYSVSIIRASIMSIIMMIAAKLGREYDPFNSLSIAGIVIYLINPLCVFDVAFLLSFSCILGIIMLYSPIQKLLVKFKINEKLSKAIAMSLATTIAIMIVMAYYFKTLNIISLVANVILIPIFTFAFEIVFVISFLSLLPFCSHLGYFLLPVNYILNFISFIATWLGNLSISNFNTISFNFITIFIYFLLLLFIGRFCTSKYQLKILSGVPILAILLYFLL